MRHFSFEASHPFFVILPCIARLRAMLLAIIIIIQNNANAIRFISLSILLCFDSFIIIYISASDACCDYRLKL